MFLGEYQHTLDAKGRVILPARFREQLEDGAVIAKTREKCLAVYPPHEWEEVARRARQQFGLGARERQAARSLFAGAAEISPDRQGRIAIPANLREYGGLERDVVVIGAFTHIEIWDSGRWTESNVGGDELLAGEDLPELGT